MSDPVATGGSSALSPAHVGGRRHSRRHGKKLRLVKKSTARNILKKHGVKMRGGGEDADGGGPASPPAMGGRRRKSHGRRHSRRKSRGLFHF